MRRIEQLSIGDSNQRSKCTQPLGKQTKFIFNAIRDLFVVFSFLFSFGKGSLSSM